MKLKILISDIAKTIIDFLSNINLNFNKGDLIGIKGKTGEGKSTFMNIIMSLIEPTNGRNTYRWEETF